MRKTCNLIILIVIGTTLASCCLTSPVLYESTQKDALNASSGANNQTISISGKE